MEQNTIAAAYNAVRQESDPVYEAVAQTFRNDLQARADGVDRTGLANTPFELKYKELAEKRAKEAASAGEVGALGTLPEAVTVEDLKTNSEAKAESKTEATGKEGEETDDLEKKTRVELDEIAEKEFGFNPSDYSNKAEIIAAIEEARNK